MVPIRIYVGFVSLQNRVPQDSGKLWTFNKSHTRRIWRHPPKLTTLGIHDAQVLADYYDLPYGHHQRFLNIAAPDFPGINRDYVKRYMIS